MQRRKFLGGLAALAASAKQAAAQFWPLGLGPLQSQPPPPPPGIGYTVVVTLFGTGATYNADGTVTGTPNGAVYTYNPDTPDANTTATDLGNFVSPFANFTQGCIHCVRTDTDLRVFFRKDTIPDPRRIEIVLHLGHYRTDGSAKNLGPFSLQVLKAGVPQNIPVYTISGGGNTWVPGGSTTTGFTNVTTAYFPQMGYWSRWRWNPTPRPVIRTGAQLLPANLNLVPNFNQALGAAYGAKPGGASPVMVAYSSAGNGSAGGAPTNYNPTGINEPGIITSSIGGVGDRPELGIVPEAAADWICNGSAAMQTTMLLLGEVDGGIPWHQADGTVTSWAPHDFNAKPTYGWFPGNVGTTLCSPYTTIDYPGVFVPSANGVPSSGGNIGWSIGDLFHTPALSYVPYLVTGDPYYLENLQHKHSWLIGANCYHRSVGWNYSGPDFNNPHLTAAFPQGGVLDGTQSRGRGWWARDMAECYVATPISVPSWLRPQSYYKSISDLNQQYLDTWRSTANTAYPEWAFTGNTLFTQDDYSYYTTYQNLANGMLLSQAGLSNWLPWVTYVAQSAIGTSAGLSGWDNRWTHQYGYYNVPFSTDYGVPAAKFASYGDVWTYQKNNALYDANNQYANFWTTNVEDNGVGPLFSQWVASTAYHCNSWVCEVRAGAPVTPNIGDAIAFTISGSFTGSPVTVSHTVTAADNTALINLVITNGGTHSITADLINQINANSVLSAAGIKASISNTNRGVGSFQAAGQPGRFYISFNSDGTSTAGGPVIGAITVSGTYTANGTPTTCSLYVQANGDGVRNGTSASAVLYNRALSYQCAQSGTSATSGGPTGTTLQSPTITDGTCKWTYAPEIKSVPIYAPGNLLTTGRMFFGGPYGAGGSPNYPYWAMGGLASLASAGIANALTGMNNLKALVNDWYSINGGVTATPQRWGFSIAPVVPPGPVPVAITFSPAAPSIPDNTASGAVVATATVTMSDGSSFITDGGALTTDTPGTYIGSGNNIVTARPLTSADDGTRVINVTATTP